MARAPGERNVGSARAAGRRRSSRRTRDDGARRAGEVHPSRRRRADRCADRTPGTSLAGNGFRGRHRRGAAVHRRRRRGGAHPGPMFLSAGLFDSDRETSATRALGQAMSRLAEWQIAELRKVIDHTELDLGASGPGALASLGSTILPRMAEVQDYIWHGAPGLGRGPDAVATRGRRGPGIGGGLRRPGRVHRAVPDVGPGRPRRAGRDLREPCRRGSTRRGSDRAADGGVDGAGSGAAGAARRVGAGQGADPARRCLQLDGQSGQSADRDRQTQLRARRRRIRRGAGRPGAVPVASARPGVRTRSRTSAAVAAAAAQAGRCRPVARGRSARRDPGPAGDQPAPKTTSSAEAAVEVGPEDRSDSILAAAATSAGSIWRR